MIIKKFRVEKEDDVKAVIEQELGPEAIILTTRTVREKGIKALFATEQLEITAAVDEGDLAAYEEVRKHVPPPAMTSAVFQEDTEAPSASETLDDSLADIKRVLGKISRDVAPKVVEEEIPQKKEPELERVPAQRQTPTASSTGTYGDPRYQREKKRASSPETNTRAKSGADHVNLSREARLMQRRRDEDLTAEKAQPRTRQREESSGQSASDDFNQASERLIRRFGLEAKESTSHVLEENLEGPDKSLTLGKLREVIREEFFSAQQNVSVGSLLENQEEKVGSVRFLISKGISRDLSVQIEQELDSRFGPVDISVASPERVGRLNELKNELARRIYTAGPITLQNDRPTVAALVGPTGVGKTTTLVKIAAQYAGELKKRVAVITLDSEKVGAREQIQAFLMPLGIPLASAESGYQLQQVVASFADCDLILIDTAGRSQYNWQQVDDLVEILSHIDDLQVYLTMSATTKDLDVYGIIQQFAILDVDSFIFTKLDETIGQGILVNVCQKTRKPIRYLTMGNRVPQDLKIADSADIARKLLVQHNSREFQAIRDMASR